MKIQQKYKKVIAKTARFLYNVTGNIENSIIYIP